MEALIIRRPESLGRHNPPVSSVRENGRSICSTRPRISRLQRCPSPRPALRDRS